MKLHLISSTEDKLTAGIQHYNKSQHIENEKWDSSDPHKYLFIGMISIHYAISKETHVMQRTGSSNCVENTYFIFPRCSHVRSDERWKVLPLHQACNKCFAPPRSPDFSYTAWSSSSRSFEIKVNNRNHNELFF